MSISAKSIRLGSLWTIIFFILSFARTIVLTPLMLVHWGKALFCFWALILSARALICFLPDSFIRYVANRYNLAYHQDRDAALSLMRSGIGFLAVFSAGLCLLAAGLFMTGDLLTGYLFDANPEQLQRFHPGACLCAYMTAALVQNLQRLYAGIKEPAGSIWQNMMMESGVLLSEIILLTVLLVCGFDFMTCVLADSILIVLAAAAYMLHLYRLRPLGRVWSFTSFAAGAVLFRQAGRLYAGNFFEKLSSDGLLILLSVFRFDKPVVALFATVRTIVNTPLLAGNLLLNTYTPDWQKAYVLRDEARLLSLLRWIRVYAGGILLAGILLCYPLYQPLFLLWTRNNIGYDAGFMLLMLLATIFNLCGLGYSFILKGINAMNQLLLLMLLKAVLIMAGWTLLPPSLYSAGAVLAVTELVLGSILLPLLVRRQLQAAGLPLAAGVRVWPLLMYWLAAVALCLCYYCFG